MRLRIHWRRCSQDMPVSGSTPHRNARRTQRLTQCTTRISSSAGTSRRLTRAIAELLKPMPTYNLLHRMPSQTPTVNYGWPHEILARLSGEQGSAGKQFERLRDAVDRFSGRIPQTAISRRKVRGKAVLAVREYAPCPRTAVQGWRAFSPRKTAVGCSLPTR